MGVLVEERMSWYPSLGTERVLRRRIGIEVGGEVEEEEEVMVGSGTFWEACWLELVKNVEGLRAPLLCMWRRSLRP